MIATGDKSAFVDGDRGFCLYRTVGPDVVASPSRRANGRRTHGIPRCLLRLRRRSSTGARCSTRSLDWIPVLHDRGYDFFKLGEEAHVSLITSRRRACRQRCIGQILRRGERDGRRGPVLPPAEVGARLDELETISSDWLRNKGLAERQFSIGFFDREYLSRYPCAMVRRRPPAPHHRVCEPARGARPPGTVGRPDASAKRWPEGDGLPVRLAVPARQGPGVLAIRPGHGPARIGRLTARSRAPGEVPAPGFQRGEQVEHLRTGT